MEKQNEVLEQVIIKFAGDSGDGMQLTGTQFTNTAALFGNDLSTFPDFPAEIRAPQGTLAGVSGYQLHFGSVNIYTPGDKCDVLVAMNAAALKANLKNLKEGGIIIANSDGFDPKNLRLANYPDGKSPLEDDTLGKFNVITMDVTKMTRAALVDSGLGTKEIDRAKNMFVLGFLYWMYNRSLDITIKFLEDKFGKKPAILDANLKVLRAGYNYGDTTETFRTRYQVQPAKMATGSYRNIMGNQATAIGLVAASHQAGIPLFVGTYPITPASDILHELSKHKSFGVKTFQAEDEIAGICTAIGASFGGSLAVTTSSGPGIALKGEAMGLAIMLEIPLVVINVQRGGPSTGLPTKTEQSDLLQALYGRNGEAPMPVIAAYSPGNCFYTAFEACRIALEHMTPVMMLSDGYIANGAEPWQYPTSADLKKIDVKFATEKNGEHFLPYKRDEKLSRPWALPGTKGLEHRIGGLEKQHETGNISYDSDNHQFMVRMRESKVEKIADYIPQQTLDSGPEKGKLLVVGWGSTYGAIKTACKMARSEGYDVAHAQITYLKPFPKNLGEMLFNYDKVLIPEMNTGQLLKVLRDKYFVPAIGLNKIMGIPFSAGEIKDKIVELCK
ncbi:MAG TPA: 2-oxoacid:acceptor oxidoreductase subunit alpha [Bacteroidia bacterium]|nr:MAG: 2-oxoacid:acceptor oxidoreductase subunit alpha [Bacteroidetes bacterium OLB10]MBV6453253.1 2-oxoglutarate oxidoreductase subunit KorA [Bacteroidia bacterium]MBX3105352.1 2-oxoacid:acceptor oxidoreductase subunit alpha [Bacteroidota bacterium]MCB8930897.1 2-oxoacid:acceptor oxidoreductase subunit alpha [Bacteroidia bacterium]MCO5289173.1 2-oxoacid:acceptor oxidoreductase subunit alpha [Bacteroidota bacterium]